MVKINSKKETGVNVNSRYTGICICTVERCSFWSGCHITGESSMDERILLL